MLEFFPTDFFNCMFDQVSDVGASIVMLFNHAAFIACQFGIAALLLSVCVFVQHTDQNGPFRYFEAFLL